MEKRQEEDDAGKEERKVKVERYIYTRREEEGERGGVVF